MSYPGDKAEKVQEDFDKFFSRIGNAVIRWAHVDRNVFDLCINALKTNGETAAAIFYKSSNIKDHLMSAGALFRYALREANKNEWKLSLIQ
ncbi:MAG: hypothetical protein J2P49_02120 [Methylocapsa sp.]|nr:hypothetical protein [Methylocapsa sp.]